MSLVPFGGGLFRNTPYWLNFIVDGKGYKTSFRTTVAGGATANIFQARTPPETLIHILSRTMTFQSGGPFIVELIEAPTTITDGAPYLRKVNQDRRSGRTAELLCFTNPTGITGGNVIDDQFVNTSGSGSNAAGAAGAEGFERILRPNTNYILRVQNTGGNTATVHLDIIWYESDN